MNTTQIKDTLAFAVNQAIKEQRDARKCTQSVIAKRLKLTQPRLSELVNYHLHLFSVESLVKIAGRLGLQVTIATSRKPA